MSERKIGLLDVLIGTVAGLWGIFWMIGVPVAMIFLIWKAVFG